MPYDTAKNVFIILTLAAIAKNGRTAIYVLSEAGFEIEQIRKYQCEISNWSICASLKTSVGTSEQFSGSVADDYFLQLGFEDVLATI